MRAESFCANPGERFSFIGDNGLKWEGTCKELRPINDGQFQFRGILSSGNDELVDTEICGHYDPSTESIEIIN